MNPHNPFTVQGDSLLGMNIQVQSVSPRDEFGMVHVKIAASAKRPTDVIDGATFELFIEATDSFAEIRKRSLEKMRAMAQEILDAPAAESNDEDEQLAIPDRFLKELEKKLSEPTSGSAPASNAL